MDSSAVSEEEVGDLLREESIPRRSCSKISGSGDKLGDIPRTNYEINKRKADELKLLHSILFDRPGKFYVLPQSASVKKNLRLFNGFPFDADSSEFTKKREKMLRNSNLNNTKLKLICTVLDLEKKGTHLDLINRILNFLIAPKNSGKLKKIVENLLKEANLEEMTMKQICQKVFDTYPEHDLSGRKDFIKQTVKTVSFIVYLSTHNMTTVTLLLQLWVRWFGFTEQLFCQEFNT
ncbi:hypothetical protein XENOCAPTIV_003967 [Xenoophorus captivus]|uniref:DEK-C domain-containing protein n=1 Tax=Xenoophorus captivus TaxID=1517983 RepID=A0ABV0SF58_9TELE